MNINVHFIVTLKCLYYQNKSKGMVLDVKRTLQSVLYILFGKSGERFLIYPNQFYGIYKVPSSMMF